MSQSARVFPSAGVFPGAGVFPSTRVFSIPPGCAFLPTLADALLDGRLAGPLAPDLGSPSPVSPGHPTLADATIYVPTRRAARALVAELALRGGGRAQLLPRIVPLGETDEAEFDLAGLEGSTATQTDVLRPPIPPLERRLILTR
ncbi:MAG: hypothetical protein ABWY78_22775, partial [Microvirga sp.]